MVGFAVAYAFHSHLIHWLNQPLPEAQRKPVTFGVTEPFFTSIKVSLYAGFAAGASRDPLPALELFAPAIEENSQRVISVFVALASGLFAGGLAFGYWVVLPAGVHFLVNYDQSLYTIQVRASYYYSFARYSSLRSHSSSSCRSSCSRSSGCACSRRTMLRNNRRMGYFVMFIIAVLLPTVDPVSTRLRDDSSAHPLRGLDLAREVLREALAQGSGRLTYPKIELHVHLEGTVRAETLLEIARRNDYALPADTVEGLAGSTSTGTSSTSSRSGS